MEPDKPLHSSPLYTEDLGLKDYSRLFPDLPPYQPEDDLLKKLGGHMGPMVDRDFGRQGDAKLRSAGFTFLGQFIVHDISLDRHSSVNRELAVDQLKNYRTPQLELDSVYGKGPDETPELYYSSDLDLLKVGKNDKGNDNDLPRDKKQQAIIGDHRNDENKVISQLHLAFIKFHNAVVKDLRKQKVLKPSEIFKEARKIVRWHYQWMVLYDFLPQIVDKELIEKILKNGPQFYQPGRRITVPIEFSAAAFRFGHSIVKPHYVMNDIFGGGIFHQLKGLQPVLEKETVQWRHFFRLDPSEPMQMGRRIDAKIAQPLFDLPQNIIPGMDIHSLPLISLLKGKTLGLPSGEDVAEVIGAIPLGKDETGLADLGFDRTPLWYYILREADLQQDGERLGQVGGTIVAEVLIGLLLNDPESFIRRNNHWRPTLKSAIPGHFTTEDLLHFAGVATNKANQSRDPDTRKRLKRLKKYHRKYKKVKINDPVKFGRWDILPYDSQIEAVHMSLLPTGKVLYYSGFRVAEKVDTETRVWNPTDGDIKKPQTFGDIFCAGHCHTADGQVLSTGGTMEYRNLPPIPPWVVRIIRPLTPLIAKLFGRFQKYPISFAGPTYLYLFNVRKEEWEFVDDMKGGRWYPTNTLLPDGRVLILSGTDEAGGFGNSKVYAAINRRVEVYDNINGLEYVADIPDFTHGKHMHGQGQDEHQGHEHDHGTGISADEGPDDDSFPSVYPRMFIVPVGTQDRTKYPKGRAFCAGYGPETKMLDLATWKWDQVDNLKFGIRRDGCAVLLPLRPPHYEAEVIHFGGSTKGGLKAHATNTAEMIDLSQLQPKWQEIESCKGPRVNGVSVLLPTGKILALSGNATGRFEDPNHQCEIFDPETKTWSYTAEQRIPRGYHCTAVLLPNGSVLASGTTPLGKYELGMEVYYPEYFFKGIRPLIRQVPAEIQYAHTFEVEYIYTDDVDQAVLISPGSMTHAFDMNQRFVELSIEDVNNKRLILGAPPDAHIAPPGYYMLFILSKQGVPSVSKFVRLTASQNTN